MGKHDSDCFLPADLVRQDPLEGRLLEVVVDQTGLHVERRQVPRQLRQLITGHLFDLQVYVLRRVVERHVQPPQLRGPLSLLPEDLQQAGRALALAEGRVEGLEQARPSIHGAEESPHASLHVSSILSIGLSAVS